jgi:tetratricopeptide (TPR) repeat protein
VVLQRESRLIPAIFAPGNRTFTMPSTRHPCTSYALFSRRTQEIKLFYCYAREDKPLRDELEKHLAWLKRRYQLTNWHDREILPGEEWEQAIDTHLNTAHLILLLINPDFMASDYCSGKEMQRAFEQAIHLDPNFAPTYNGKGLALTALGKKIESQKAYEKARQLGDSSKQECRER